MIARVHVRVQGRVQGVFFRTSACDAAENLGLNGWVRNLPDGCVETVAEGPEEAVEAYVAWCRRGPPGAVVRSVDCRREAPVGETGGFRITR